MLLSGDGKSFVDYYNEYLERIYNMDIPLSEIANKSKVKKTIQQYKIGSFLKHPEEGILNPSF